VAGERILLGVIGRPHGVRGHLHVHSYTARPADLAGYATLGDAAGRRFRLRWVGSGVAEMTELSAGAALRIEDRAAAERLTNVELFVDRAELPAPDEDEFYLADLIGQTATTPDGAVLGKVAAVHDYGAGTSIEIAAASGPVLVPDLRAGG
jgi:16S rRNA processing protein RimM